METEHRTRVTLHAYAQQLQDAGIERVWKETRILAAHALSVPYDAIWAHTACGMTEEEKAMFEAYVARRVQHEPITKIIGRVNFWKYAFYSSRDTLDPRPESERMIDAVLQNYPDSYASLKVCDLGTGTGCLLLSVLGEYPQATGLGVDQSEAALQIAQKNAEGIGVLHRVRFLKSNWCQDVTEKFHIVLCNPPYIAHDADLEQDVLFDPPTALFAGNDGLDAYRHLLPELPAILLPGAKVFLEIGKGQLEALDDLAEKTRFEIESVWQDYNAIDRILILRMKS